MEHLLARSLIIHREAVNVLIFSSYSSEEEDKEWEEMVDNYRTYQVKLKHTALTVTIGLNDNGIIVLI